MLYDALLRHCCPEANILPRIPSRLKVMSCRMMARCPGRFLRFAPTRNELHM